VGKILVTGGAGYIGSHVVHALLDSGEEPVVVDTLVTGNRFSVPDTVVFEKLDVGDEARIGALIRDAGVDAVMHFAASTVVPESVSDPLKYYINNTANTARLWRACRDNGVKSVVFSSTAATYGEVGLEPVTERHPTQPVSPYGWSKLMSEQALRDLSATGALSAVIMRYFNVAGADPELRTGQSTPEATHLIKVAAEAATGQREALTIYGDTFDTPDGTGVRDYIHVSDLAAAHIAALRYLRAGGETTLVNAGYGEGISVRQVVDALNRLLNAPITVKIGPPRPGDPASVVADATKIGQTLDWTPQHNSLDLIVRTAVEWERKRLQMRGN